MRSSGAWPHLPASYLELYGSSLGVVWKRYCAAINAFGETADQRRRESTVAAAIQTFDACGSVLAALS